MNELVLLCYFSVILFLTYRGYQAQKNLQTATSTSSSSNQHYFFAKGRVSDIAISLSLFATIFSSITFLGVPGEIITFGLAFTAVIPGYFLTSFLVNKYLVARLYSQEVDHIYQLLGKKYGIGIQRLAVFYYFMLRVSWMAVLIYMSGKSICVVYGIDTSYALPIAMCLSTIAIIYCTLGGLITVIKTDSLQGISMFVAIGVLTVFILTELGPSKFISSIDFSHWGEQPIISFDPSSRLSFFGRAIMSVIWLLALYMGDQVSYQRIRSSESIDKAKKAIWNKAFLSSLLVVFLVGAAFSLLAFYGANPELIPEKSWFQNSGDLVLPHFIGLNLLPGLAGLVLVGLLSASMSSVDSVVNGFTAILSDGETFPLASRIPRMQLSLGMGAFVLAWVAVIPHLQGSILEIAGKLTIQLHVFVAAFLFVYFFLPKVRASALGVGIPIATVASVFTTYSKEISGLQTGWVGYEWTALAGVFLVLCSVLIVDFLIESLHKFGILTRPEQPILREKSIGPQKI